MVSGIHHITAIASSPKQNIEFYTKILNLRFVKQTVNFDDPSVFHFYYGNKIGSPGSALTFFVGWDIPKGIQGSGAMDYTIYTIDQDQKQDWLEHFEKHGVAYDIDKNPYGDEVIMLSDHDDLPLMLELGKKSAYDLSLACDPTESNVLFSGARLNVESSQEITNILTNIFEMQQVAQSKNAVRYQFQNSRQWIDVYESPDTMPARQGIGSVHHIAFRAKNEDHQKDLQRAITSAGLHPTQVIDRIYFKSVYFRTPAGILFEIATDNPGFTIDESKEKLGKKLQLPPWYEPHREKIEHHLHTIN